MDSYRSEEAKVQMRYNSNHIDVLRGLTILMLALPIILVMIPVASAQSVCGVTGIWTTTGTFYVLDYAGNRGLQENVKLVFNLTQSGNTVTGKYTIYLINYQTTAQGLQDGAPGAPDAYGSGGSLTGTLSGSKLTLYYYGLTYGGRNYIEQWDFSVGCGQMSGGVTNLDSSSFTGHSSDANAFNLLNANTNTGTTTSTGKSTTTTGTSSTTTSNCPSGTHLSNPSPSIQICVPDGKLQVVPSGSVSEVDTNGNAVPINTLSPGDSININSGSITFYGPGFREYAKASGWAVTEAIAQEGNSGWTYFPLTCEAPCSPGQDAAVSAVNLVARHIAIGRVAEATGCVISCEIVLYAWAGYEVASKGSELYFDYLSSHDTYAPINCNAIKASGGILVCDPDPNLEYFVSVSNGSVAIKAINGTALIAYNGSVFNLYAGRIAYFAANSTYNKSATIYPIQNSTGSGSANSSSSSIGGSIILLVLIAVFVYIVYRVYKFVKGRPGTVNKKDTQTKRKSGQ